MKEIRNVDKELIFFAFRDSKRNYDA